jgi:GNAT superfamily N-acetyltransferase
MDELSLSTRMLSADEFIRLRSAVGWHVPDAESASLALENTLFGVCLEVGGECVGFGRVVGDGALVFHVQDVIVLPQHQRKGYGRIIMKALMDYIHSTARPTAFIALFASSSAKEWYKRYGFEERPGEVYGPGMAFFKE